MVNSPFGRKKVKERSSKQIRYLDSRVAWGGMVWRELDFEKLCGSITKPLKKLDFNLFSSEDNLRIFKRKDVHVVLIRGDEESYNRIEVGKTEGNFTLMELSEELSDIVHALKGIHPKPFFAQFNLESRFRGTKEAELTLNRFIEEKRVDFEELFGLKIINKLNFYSVENEVHDFTFNVIPWGVSPQDYIIEFNYGTHVLKTFLDKLKSIENILINAIQLIEEDDF